MASPGEANPLEDPLGVESQPVDLYVYTVRFRGGPMIPPPAARGCPLVDPPLLRGPLVDPPHRPHQELPGGPSTPKGGHGRTSHFKVMSIGGLLHSRGGLLVDQPPQVRSTGGRSAPGVVHWWPSILGEAIWGGNNRYMFLFVCTCIRYTYTHELTNINIWIHEHTY